MKYILFYFVFHSVDEITVRTYLPNCTVTEMICKIEQMPIGYYRLLLLLIHTNL